MTAKLFFPWILHFMTNRYKNKHHHLVVDTIFSLILITLFAFNAGLGYWFFLERIPVDARLEITVPEYVISGHEFDIAVGFENPNKNIQDVEIILDYPEGYTYDNSSLAPKEGTDNIFPVGDLGRGQQGNFIVHGHYLGDVDRRDAVTGSISYRFHRSSSKDAFLTNFIVQDSTFETLVELPDKILRDDPFDIIIKYKNSSPLVQQDVRINLGVPEGLELNVPEGFDYNADTKTLNLGEVSAWQEGEIIIPAVFTYAPGGVTNIITVNPTVAEGGRTYAQQADERQIFVLTPRMNITTAINGSGNAVANFEDNLNFSATVHNIGDAPLNNVVVTGNLEGSPGSYNYVNAPGGSVSGNQIIWVIPHLEPGQSATVNLNAQISSGVNLQNFSMGFNASATAQIDDLGVTTYTPASSSSRVVFNSRLTFIAEAQYYGPEGSQLGYGPYPMEAGNITALRVFWKIQDFTNDLNNLTVQTTLPSQVEWTGITSVSDGTAIAYDPATRTVTWHVHKLDAFTHPQGANFEVRVTPNFQQVGSHINITNDSKLTAQDSYTNVVLTRYAGAVRTKDPILEEK